MKKAAGVAVELRCCGATRRPAVVMALFGITLLGVTAGLFQADRALNTFAVLMIPAIAALVYTSLNGVPESVAKVLLRE